MLIKCGDILKTTEEGDVLKVTEEYAPACMEKIDALKRIEEKLNFNLLILGQAIVSGIYFGTPHGIEYAEGNILCIDAKNKCININIGLIPRCRYFKDYNETWALTKDKVKQTFTPYEY